MSGRRTDAAMFALCALGPACLVAAHVGNVPDLAHDPGVARVLGLDAQPWRALDTAMGALLIALPIGTRAARAALGGALITAVTGGVLYGVVRRLLGACAETRRLGFLVAAIAATLPLFATSWLIEAGAVGGTAIGALLVLLPLGFLIRMPPKDVSPPRDLSWAVGVAFAVGLAAGYEPLVGVCACGGCATFIVASSRLEAAASRSWRWREHAGPLCASFLCGLAPLLVALVRTRASGVSVASSLASAWAGESGASHAGSPVPFVSAEMGPVLALLAVAGAALASLVPRARPLAFGLAAVALLGLACGWAGAPLGPSRFGAPILAALIATSALAAVAMQAIVRGVARARVPFARESAAMVLLLVLVLPIDRADEALALPTPRTPTAAAGWGDATWGELAPRSFVLLTDPHAYERLRADRARGAVRGDLTFLPASIRSARARRLLAEDASLVPLWRDIALLGAPSEVSLSSMAASRPVVMVFDPAWGRALARHLVPLALFDRFEPEPLGASDRRVALVSSAPQRERLALIARSEPELALAASSVLQARKLGTDLDGDRGVTARALSDLHAFEPGPP